MANTINLSAQSRMVSHLEKCSRRRAIYLLLRLIYREVLGFLMDRHEIEVVGADGSQGKAHAEFETLITLLHRGKKAYFFKL